MREMAVVCQSSSNWLIHARRIAGSSAHKSLSRFSRFSDFAERTTKSRASWSIVVFDLEIWTAFDTVSVAALREVRRRDGTDWILIATDLADYAAAAQLAVHIGAVVTRPRDLGDALVLANRTVVVDPAIISCRASAAAEETPSC